VENNAYLVRAANTGISAVVHPSGRVLTASDLFEEGVLVQTIRTRSGDTFYTRYGDVFAWLSLLGTVVPIAAKGGWRRVLRRSRVTICQLPRRSMVAKSRSLR
jgi:apolipoprotein N-acyltransferase